MSSTPPNAPTVPKNIMIDDKDLAFGRTVVPVVNKNKTSKKDVFGFEYAEHCFIGDSIKLTLTNGKKVAASDHKFSLKNGLSVTYGQINGLAGDFYGTVDPISDGKDDIDQSARFVRAYNTLAEASPRQPKEAMGILAMLQTEVDAVNKALANHQDPSTIYPKLPDMSLKLQWITIGRPKDQPAYLGLAKINWDHFGIDARTTYNAGHGTAIQKAISGDLEGAYTMNAFADHFLEDSFSAGHLRTPRRLLHRSIDIAADFCAKLMHDEDNAIGLSVKNPRDESWTLYGDKRALDEVDQNNEEHCVAAVQASADEIYQAYQTKKAPLPSDYQAWTHAPMLDSVKAHQTLSPLFTFKNERRRIIENRRLWEFKTNWWFGTTAAECEYSGWWKYPITIDGPKKVLMWSSVAAATGRLRHICVFYQNQNGDIHLNEHLDTAWVGKTSGLPIFKAVLFTPLASISWKGGKEARVYYLNDDYILQEYCYSADKGCWFPGEIGDMKIQADYNAAVAAIQWNDDQGRAHIRVYCQESGSNTIKEFCNDGNWSRGSDLPVALSGSSIAVIRYQHKGLHDHIRLYYQTEDLSIKEHCLDERGWYLGELNLGKAPGCVPISAVAPDNSASGIVELQVYWRNLENEIVQRKNTGSWGPVNTVFRGLKPGTQFAVTQWGYLRLYYQAPDGSIIELCSNGNDGDWIRGAKVGDAL